MRILLVDDEREEREGISFLIEKFHYPLEIFQASSGKEALDILEKNKIDILFTDVKMPVMSGLELAKRVREKDKDIKIIIFSAYAEFEYAKQAIEMNALRYLLKPIEIDEFKILMDELISSLEKTRQMSKRDLLFKVFTGVKLEKESQEMLEKEVFLSSANGYRFINIEFVNNYFEENEQYFFEIIKRYLGQKIEYIPLYPNEACIILMDNEINKSKKLAENIKRMSEAMHRCVKDEWILFISPPVFQMVDFVKYCEKMDVQKSELFGYGNRIVVMDQYCDRLEHYVPDIEMEWNQLLSSLDSKNLEIISKQNSQLVNAILSNAKVSRLYVQNILYSVIKSMYDKLPGIDTEKVMVAAESLFKARDSKTILDVYEDIVNRIIQSCVVDKEETDMILRIKGIVEKQYMKDISLDYVAKQVHLAPAYVSYVFKQETGQSLIKYITDIKMAKARRFLEDKDMKIIQVGKACGYENQSYFNRLFKNYHGVTPKQYREQL